MIDSFIGAVVLAGFAVGLVLLYLLPVLLACARRLPDIGTITVINLLLGWTLAGWVVALALALRSVTQAPPAVQVFQQLPPAPPPPGWPAPRDPGASPPPARRPGTAPPLILPPHSAETRPEDWQPPGEDGGQQWPH